MLDGDTIPLDHYVLFPPYLAADDAETLDGIVRGDPIEIESRSMVSLAAMDGAETARLCRVVYAMAQRRYGTDGIQVRVLFRLIL